MPNTEERDKALYWPEATLSQALAFYESILDDPKTTNEDIARLGQLDRFFLLTHILHRPDAIEPWLYERCREVEANTDGYLDLWARDHYKSTIITFAGIMQEIINDPEITIGIFSHSRPISKAFLSQLMQEMETNKALVRYYPDIFWENPKGEASIWSKDNGLIVKRKGNPKESTVEAWGLVDAQPTSKHFRLLVLDDVVTPDSVTNADMIKKTTDAWELAQNLGTSRHPRAWHIGTRYNMADTYGELLKRKALIPRIHAATDDGTPDGNPVFLSKAVWEKKKRDASLYTIACQQLQNPVAGKVQELSTDWLRTYEVRPRTLNIYILGDYAGSRKQSGSCKTALVVLGMDVHRNKYLLDGACHDMTLGDRWKLLKHYHKKWSKAPGIQTCKVGYERYGAQTDIQHFETMMQMEPDAYPFPIQEVNHPREGAVDKDNRIRRLIPDLQNWRFFIPYEGDVTSMQEKHPKELWAKPIMAISGDGDDREAYNVTKWWIANEYVFFPHSTQKDFLDAMNRIYDLDPVPPVIYDESDVYPEPE